MQNLNSKSKFNLLPEAIRDWLLSFEATEEIVKINDSLKLSGPKRKVIPALTTKFLVKELDSKTFILELAKGLGKSQEQAKQIAIQIAQKVLAPVKDGLKNTQNIDISPLLASAAAPKQASATSNMDSLAQKQAPERKSVSAFASMQKGSLAQQASAKKAQAKNAPQAPSANPSQEVDLSAGKNFKAEEAKEKGPVSEQKTQQASKPFMLHEETPKAPAQNNSQAQAPDFSFELPSSSKPKVVQKPKTKVSFGSFFNRQAKAKDPSQAPKVESKKEAPKVVHYSAFRTMLGDSEDQKQE